jgi:putative ABC transport system substrate-binding protein
VRRRRFLAFLSAAPVIRPIVAAAQSADRVRRVGVLIPGHAGPGTQPFAAAVQRQLRELGWVEGRNLQIDLRYAPVYGEPARQVAKELLGLQPDVILVGGNPVFGLREETRTVPIVFVLMGDPVANGLVASLAHPGGNITGFTHYDADLAGKWLEVLREIAPRVTRVAALVATETRDLRNSSLSGVESATASFGVRLLVAGADDAAEIERAITAFAAEPNGGLIVLPSAITADNREVIITLAARYRLPAVYPFRLFITDGGLISYGIDLNEHWRQGAVYVDRILRGAKPADLPVQRPTKFELVINLNTAKALGLTVPPVLLARADEVIE